MNLSLWGKWACAQAGPTRLPGGAALGGRGPGIWSICAFPPEHPLGPARTPLCHQPSGSLQGQKLIPVVLPALGPRAQSTERKTEARGQGLGLQRPQCRQRSGMAAGACCAGLAGLGSWEGWGLFLKCAPHPAVETAHRSSAWNARRQAQRRLATGAGRPAPGRSGSGGRVTRVSGRPGPALGAGAGSAGERARAASGICMTKARRGGSGRAQPARGRSCPAKPPPRARRPPEIRGGGGTRARRSAVFARGAPRGAEGLGRGTKAGSDRPAGGEGEGRVGTGPSGCRPQPLGSRRRLAATFLSRFQPPSQEPKMTKT